MADDGASAPTDPDAAPNGDGSADARGLTGFWTQLRTAPVGGSYGVNALVYDSKRDRFDLWLGGLLLEWDPISGRWENRTPTPLPSSWPPGRPACGMAFDSIRGRLVVFGGYVLGLDTSNEIWEYDGASGAWENRTPSPLPSSWPSRRASPAMAFDSARGKVVMFSGDSGEGNDGGSDGGQQAPETWEWDGASGTWTRRLSTAVPPVGYYGSFGPSRVMVFDEGRRRTWLMVGPELWSWDGAAGTWTSRTPFPLPPLWPRDRFSFGMALDTSRSRLVTFGGRRAGSAQFESDDLWEYDVQASSWTLVPPVSTWPSPRADVAMAFDPMRSRSLVFGGTGSNGSNAELWSWAYR